MKKIGNLETQGDFKDSIWFKTSCRCGMRDHICEVNIDIDKEESFEKIISMNFYIDTNWADKWDYYSSNWSKWDRLTYHISRPFRVFWKRFKACMRLMFTGYIEMSTEFMFRDESHARDFAEALIEGADYVKNKEKEKEEARKNKSD